jgi:hypothetical protein
MRIEHKRTYLPLLRRNFAEGEEREISETEELVLDQGEEKKAVGEADDEHSDPEEG